MSCAIGIAMVRDEEDIIAATVTQMMSQVDAVLVADNGSVDRTRDILDGLGPRCHVVDDPDPAYWQSEKMTKLAHLAHRMGADWVVPFDADELWTCQWGRIADVLDTHTRDFGLVTAELVDHMATGRDPTGGDIIDRLPWRRIAPLPLPKVACRATFDVTIEQGNHWARYPIPARETPTPAFVVHHYPRRTIPQFIHKVRIGAAAYAATEGLDESVGAHWRRWGAFDDEQLAELFRVYYYREDPTVPVVFDGEPQPPLIFDPPIRARP